MLNNGIHSKVASERLGHSKVGITLDLYSQEDAVERVDEALAAAINRRPKYYGSKSGGKTAGSSRPAEII